MKQTHLYISGKVHGVGFRQFVKSHARRLGLFGWVRNLPDGRVEAVIQGEKDEVDELIAFCHKGPMLSEVKSVEILEEEMDTKFHDFTIEK